MQSVLTSGHNGSPHTQIVSTNAGTVLWLDILGFQMTRSNLCLWQINSISFISFKKNQCSECISFFFSFHLEWHVFKIHNFCLLTLVDCFQGQGPRPYMLWISYIQILFYYGSHTFIFCFISILCSLNCLIGRSEPITSFYRWIQPN